MLGYEKDYTDETNDVTHEGQNTKEKPGNAQNLEEPRIVNPLDFTKIKMLDILHEDKEHYFMNQKELSKIDC